MPSVWHARVASSSGIIVLAHGLTGEASEHVRQPGLRIDVVELGRLCRSPNYAEPGRFPQISG